MRRLLLAALAALVLAPAAAAAPGFSYGVAAGEITSTSAVVWTRSNELGPVRLHLWPAPRRGMPFVQVDVRPTAARDRVVQRRVFGLRPNTRYTYMFSTPFPVATNTQNREVDSTLGKAGLGSAIVALFYKPQPPNGVGMACASGNVYSYASVRVTATALTVTPRDQAGKLVREETGAPCGPFTFRAR